MVLRLGDRLFAVFTVLWPITILFTGRLLLYACQYMSYMKAVILAMISTFAVVVAVAWVGQYKVYKPLCKIEKGIIKKLENE